MSQSKDDGLASASSVSFLCDCLGISRQGYYTHTDRLEEIDVLRTSIVLYCQEVLSCQLPRAGMRELYALCKQRFGEKLTIGRDQCYSIFRSNGLLRRRRKRPRTTNSCHNFHIYPDLLNTTPKLVARRLGQLVVGDITYVPTNAGWAYLSLLTDATSRMIVGWALKPTLEASGPLEALDMAKDFYVSHGVDLRDVIHHSDRGIQYCCHAYIDTLKEHGISISMTQTGDPLHNALAERMNNTIKNGWLFDCETMDFEKVAEHVAHSIRMYNTVRPHMALGMITPESMVEELTA